MDASVPLRKESPTTITCQFFLVAVVDLQQVWLPYSVQTTYLLLFLFPSQSAESQSGSTEAHQALGRLLLLVSPSHGYLPFLITVVFLSKWVCKWRSLGLLGPRLQIQYRLHVKLAISASLIVCSLLTNSCRSVSCCS